MAQINKSSDYFRTKLYQGNSTDNTTITWDETDTNFGSNLFLWLKTREYAVDPAQEHWLTDSVRGATKFLESNSTNAEVDIGGNYAYTTNGFVVDNAARTNRGSMVGWGWNTSGSASSNTDGSITSTVSANTTSGFSIVKYTGNGSDQTVGHGLGVAPSLIIVKCLTTVHDWVVYHSSLGNGSAIALNLTDASYGATAWQNTSPTNQVFYIKGGANSVSQSGDFIAYCFAEKKGFSKFGKFTSNGSDDGTFTYCGFKPAWIMMKANVTDAWSHWYIFDNKRDAYNLADLPQYANLSIQDGYYGGTPATNYSQIDMLSNGFKIRRDGNWGLGGNGTEVIYMAFAESPLVGTNNIPAVAR